MTAAANFDILAFGREALKTEADAILKAVERLDDSFVKAVNMILETKGKVIITGVGKSGIIAHKIAGTLACAGIPALFLHASEALHGDVGVVTKDDLVIAISKSGESDEFRMGLIDAIKSKGAKIIGFTANPDSTLGKKSDVILDISVDNEICPLGISATSSTTLTLALGDALAMAAMNIKGTTLEQFAILHRGGAVGRELKHKN